MSKFLPQALRGLLATSVLALALPIAHADTVFDNLGSSRDGSDPLLSYGPLADSFRTGSDPAYWLGSVTALLKSGSADVIGDVRVSLHADSSNAPGALLATLGTLSSASISTADFASYVFTPAQGVQLTANTTYWIEIEALTPNAVEWSWSNDLGAIGVAGGYNYNALLGVSANESFSPYQMAVAVQAVPEPTSMALLIAGLGVIGLWSGTRRGLNKR